MLLWGVSNPEGVDLEHSIYLTRTDIHDIISQIDHACTRGNPIPVKLEHKGVSVGKVVSAWAHEGQLQCILQLDETVLEGSLGSEFVRQGIVRDLSLGYEVSMQNSDNKICINKKTIKEISIVKKGARKNCHILAAINSSSPSALPSTSSACPPSKKLRSQ